MHQSTAQAPKKAPAKSVDVPAMRPYGTAKIEEDELVEELVPDVIGVAIGEVGEYVTPLSVAAT